MASNVVSRRARFVASLVAGSSVSAAAICAGVSERTAVRWHALPEVRADLRRLADDALHQAASQAAAEASTSLRVLADLRDNAEVLPAVRVRACAVILEHARALHADIDILERIAALEARMGQDER